MSINLYPANWKAAWHAQLLELRQQYPKAHIYGLVEGVLNEACYTVLKRSGSLSYFALYANTPSADDETLSISPILVEYMESGRHAWESLLSNTNGRSALSIIVTTESLMQLVDRLTPWCVVDADGHTLALSFADTRILPELFGVLTPQQLAQLCGPAVRWQYLERTSVWQQLPLPSNDGNNSAPADMVELDDKQCARLLDACEADNVLFQLRRSASDLVDCHTPARAHELVRYWLNCADHAQIIGASDRFNLCSLGLTHLHLENSLLVAIWLADASQPQTFDALSARWVDNAGT